MRQPLIEIGYKLQQAMQRVAPEEQHKKEKQEKAALAERISRRNEDETKLIRQRIAEIEKRKEELEKRKELEEKEAEEERKRQEDERIKREQDRELQRKRDQELVQNKEMLEELKKKADLSKGSNVKIEGKKITEIDAADLGHMDQAKIKAARQAQITRERQEKIRQRKLESKRVDHLVRACREEESHLLGELKEKVEKEDRAYLDKAEANAVEEQRQKHKESLIERDMLIGYQNQVDDWQEGKLKIRREEHDQKVEERKDRVFKAIVANKIARAKQRYKEWLEKQDEQEREVERKRQEKIDEERREREEEEKAERERLAAIEEERKEE